MDESEFQDARLNVETLIAEFEDKQVIYVTISFSAFKNSKLRVFFQQEKEVESDSEVRGFISQL